MIAVPLGTPAGAFLVATVFVITAGTAIAHAAQPTIPCDYECMWPLGTHEQIPQTATVGTPFTIKYSYSWDGSSPAFNGWGEWPPPPGRRLLPPEQQQGMPVGYTGSTVTLRLPQEITVEDWEKRGFEKNALWIDANGHATHEYKKLNAHKPGTLDGEIRLLVSERPRYANTEIVIDLGTRDKGATMPLRLFANPGAPGSISIGERLELATGQAIEPGRGIMVYPPPTTAPIHGWELGVTERAMLDGFLEGSSTGQAEGASSDSALATAYAYGYLLSAGRTDAVRGAANVRVCLHDAGSGGTSNDPLRTGDNSPACTFTTDSGFYGLAVPTADPDGDGTVDIVARFSLMDEVATVAGAALEAPAVNDIRGQLVSLGATTISPASSFRYALVAHADAHRAHEFFANAGLSVPHIQIEHGDPPAAYFLGTDRIRVQLDENLPPEGVVFHEYAHYAMFSAYPSNAFPGLNCLGHTIDGPVEQPECVWTEGWATLVGSLISDNPSYLRIDFERRILIDSAREFISAAKPGSNREVNVIAALWDLYDDRNDDEEIDNVSSTSRTIMDVIFSKASGGGITPIRTIQEFRDAWHDTGMLGLDSLLAHNTVMLDASSPQSLTVSVQSPDGTPKPSTAKKHAKTGDKIVITLGLEQPAPSGCAPKITFADGSVFMVRGGDRTDWSREHTVSGSIPEGPLRFTIVTCEGDEHVSFSEHGITSGRNAVIDNTPPAPPAARFTSPAEILLGFGEDLSPASHQSAFSVTPPPGKPITTTMASGTGNTVRLSLQTPATDGDKYTIAIPQTVTDLAGNPYAAGNVAATLDTENAPPMFSAARHGSGRVNALCSLDNCGILLTFNEPVHAVPNDMLALEDWTFTPAQTGSNEQAPPRTPDHISRAINRDRIIIGTDATSSAGTIEYSPAAARSIVDAGENPLLATSVQVGATPSLTFTARTHPDGVLVSFALPPSGKTNPSEWQIGGTAATKILDFHSNPLIASNSGDVEFTRRQTMILTNSLPTSIARPLVEYVKPVGLNANSLSHSTAGTLPSSSYLAQDDLRPRPASASFVDPQTIRLAFTEALDAPSVEAATFTADGGLGALTPSYTEGSTTVTLSAATAAADNTVYTVRISGGITDLVGHELAQRSFTVVRNDNVGPRVLDAYFAGQSQTSLAFTVNEALRPSTVTAADFGVTAEGSDASRLVPGSRASYEPLSRTVWLSLKFHESFDARLTITIPETVLDVAGNPIVTREFAVPRTPRASNIISHAFEDPNTIVYKLRTPLSVTTLEDGSMFKLTPQLGRLAVTYEEGSLELRISTANAATPGTEYATAITGLAYERGGSVDSPGPITYSGTGKPVPLSADSTSPTTTEVRFGVPVRFGDGVTVAQHRQHWTVEEGGTQKTINGIAPKTGDPLTLVITHDPLSGTSPPITVTYAGGTDDAGRVRDTATPPNVQDSGPFRLVAADSNPPRASSLALSIERGGEPRAGATHARAGDDVVVRLSLSEPAAPPNPRLVVLGEAVDVALASPGDRSSWVGRYTVPASPPQGPALFGVTARDGAGNEATIDRASLTSGEAILDTVAPTFSASTRSATQTAIKFAEPVHGSLVASAWTVDGVSALGVALGAGDGPAASLHVPPSAATASLVLTHPPTAGTGETPAVAYLRPRAAG